MSTRSGRRTSRAIGNGAAARIIVRCHATRFLRQPRHVDPRAKQAAGERLLLALFGDERHVRGGDVERLEVIARERRLGDRGAGQSDRCSSSPRESSVEAPAAEHAGPHAAFDVDDGAVGVTTAGGKAHEYTLVREAAVPCAIEGVDRSGQRVGVVQPAAVGALGGTVGHDIAWIAANATSSLS